MQDALAGQGGLLQQALCQSPIGMALVELDGSILEANAAFCALLQQDAADLRQLPLWGFLHGGERASCRELAQQVAAGARRFSQSRHRFLAADGVVRCGQLILARVSGEGCTPLLVQLMELDDPCEVTELDLEDNDCLSLVLGHLEAHVFMKDRQGRYLYANPSTLAMLGLDRSRLIGRHDAELLPPEVAESIHSFDEEVFAHGGPLWREERLPSPDGEERIFFTQKLVARQAGHGDCLIGLSTDVTELRRASEQLAASEQQFRLLAENSSDVVLLLARDGRIRWVSPSLAAALGWLPADWIGQLVTTFLVHELQLGAPGIVAREQVRAKDGTIHWIEIHANSYCTDAGELDGIVASFHVIDATVAAEEKLYVSEQRHRRLADQILDVVWAMNLDGQFTYMSPAVQRVRGFTPEEVTALPFDQQFAPASYITVVDGFRQARQDVAAGRPVCFEAELEEYCKDGSTVWTDLKASGLYDDQGQFLEIVGVSRDMTSQRALREELRISEQRYRLLAENARDVIWTMEPDGHISYVSPSIEKLRGIPPEQAMAQSLEQIHPPESLHRSQAYFQQLSEDVQAGLPPQPFRGELEYYCADGSTIWAEVIAVPVLDPQIRLQQLLGTSRDITERKHYEHQLCLANQRLEALSLTDTLTGIWNRRYLTEQIREAMVRSDRYGEALSLILCDIDYFKAINDGFGHQSGDRVLIEFCQRIRAQLREADGFGRWGGEEFLILLPHTDADSAALLAEKLRRCILQSPFTEVGTIMASFGVAQRRPQESDTGWFLRVDEQLYRAKNAGRNRVMTADRQQPAA